MWISRTRWATMVVTIGSLLPTGLRAEPAPPTAGTHPAVDAEGAAVAELTLPAGKPVVQQASYWRAATTRASASNNHVRSQNTGIHGGSRPPNPTSLAQPAWLLPESAELTRAEPVEPPGEAVYIDDADNGASSESTSNANPIDLANAQVELTPPRAVALLDVARDWAAEATTVEDFSDVIEQCHRALDAGPDRHTTAVLANLAAWAYNRRGELVAEAGDEHTAFEDFQEALRLNGQCWPALHNRGVTLARYAKRREALADFNRVVALAPNFAVARYNRGEVLSQMERWQEAVDDYTAALESMPESAALFAARGYAWHQLGQTTHAANDYNTAIRLDDSQATAYVGRGNLFAAEGLYEQAADDFQQAVRLDPHSAMAYRSVAWLLSTCPLQQYRSAEKGLEAALRLAKIVGEDDPMVLDTLAVAYANAGDFHQAITHQQRAIVLVGESERNTYEERLALFRAGKPYRTK